MIKSEFGVWPLTPSNWNESTFDLIDLIIKSNRHGVNAILQFYVDINIYNVSSNVMKVNTDYMFLFFIIVKYV